MFLSMVALAVLATGSIHCSGSSVPEGEGCLTANDCENNNWTNNECSKDDGRWACDQGVCFPVCDECATVAQCLGEWTLECNGRFACTDGKCGEVCDSLGCNDIGDDCATGSDDYPGDRSDYMWYAGNSGASVHSVGQKLPNAFGLLGNIRYVWATGDIFDDGQPLQRYATRRTWENLLDEAGLQVTKTLGYGEVEFPRNSRDALHMLKRPRKMLRFAFNALIPLNLMNQLVFLCSRV